MAIIYSEYMWVSSFYIWACVQWVWDRSEKSQTNCCTNNAPIKVATDVSRHWRSTHTAPTTTTMNIRLNLHDTRDRLFAHKANEHGSRQINWMEFRERCVYVGVSVFVCASIRFCFANKSIQVISNDSKDSIWQMALVFGCLWKSTIFEYASFRLIAGVLRAKAIQIDGAVDFLHFTSFIKYPTPDTGWWWATKNSLFRCSSPTSALNKCHSIPHNYKLNRDNFLQVYTVCICFPNRIAEHKQSHKWTTQSSEWKL